MQKSVSERQIVLEMLTLITKEGQFCHVVLGNVLDKYQYLEKRERAFITRVTEGTLEHMTEIDYIINQFSKVKVNKMKPVIRNILRMSVYQLKYMDTVPDSAVCNEAVKLASKKGFNTLKGFVNGVLRNIARNLDNITWPEDKLENLSVKYSMPSWIVKLWIDKYGIETTETMLKDFQKEKPITIRCIKSKISKEELVKELEGEGVKVVPHPYVDGGFYISGYDYLGSLDSFNEGHFAVQDVSSMLVGVLAGVEEGDNVIDVCAAPGGKSLHMADLLKGTGHVSARDLTEYKVDLINDNIERLGFLNISADVKDAAVKYDEDANTADIVIADLPCSGLGVLGKKADLKYKTLESDPVELSKIQKSILNTVCDYVKDGGVLMYSTCTIHPYENEENVRWFLNEHPEFEIESLKDKVCDELKTGVSDEGYLQTLPGIHKCDGFFICRLVKKSV